MTGRRHESEEIINKLRQAEIELGRGKCMTEVCRLLEVTEATYDRWRREYGGIPTIPAKRL